MKQNYAFLLLIAFLFLGLACSEEVSTATSVSGEIVNPQSGYIRIFHNNTLLDTVPLDKKRNFYYRFSDDFEDGLYVFQHDYDNRYETQTFYIEKGDSLQLRLNTREFDESLMFSGSNAEANNFLMSLFLENQNNSKILPNYYRIEPSDYIGKIDSIKAKQSKGLKKLRDDQKISKEFKKFAESIIEYANYDLRERYFFLVNKYNRKYKDLLPGDFLDYRKSADFNDEGLQSHYIYQYFLDDYLKNAGVEKCIAQWDEWGCFDLRTEKNLSARFQVADSLFSLKTLRSRFLTSFGARLVVLAQEEETVDSLLDVIKKSENFDSAQYKQVEQLAEVQKRQFIGNISELDLMLPTGEKAAIKKLLSRPTVFYYWSIYYESHHKNQHEKMQDLRMRYPQIKFVGINIDKKEDSRWLESLDTYQYDLTFEYQLVCPPDERNLYRNYLNKIVFVDKNGEVIDNNLNLNDSGFEEDLLGLLNK